MGLQIGQVGSGLSRYSVGEDTATRFRPPDPPELAGSRDTSRAADVFFSRDETAVLTAGFGDGTVSVPTIAVRALDKNLTGAKRLVPSIEETREKLRERLGDQRDLFSRETSDLFAREAPDPNPFVRDIGPLNLGEGQALARTRAREYINSLGEAATQAQARFGQEPEPRLDVPRIRVGDQAFPLERQETTPSFDVRV
ncbi:MAG: hypothetical protein GY851_08985 [bacterium]|nr:hypothetical protein [bacterium]